MNHHGIVHFEMVADDPDKLGDFYKQLFGWQIEKMSMDGVDYYAVMTGPVTAEGMPSEPGFINGGMTKRESPDQVPMNYVNVDSVDEYVQKAKGMGAKVFMDKMPVPAMGWFAIMADPEGNQFGVWQVDSTAA